MGAAGGTDTVRTAGNALRTSGSRARRSREEQTTNRITAENRYRLCHMILRFYYIMRICATTGLSESVSKDEITFFSTDVCISYGGCPPRSPTYRWHMSYKKMGRRGGRPSL